METEDFTIKFESKLVSSSFSESRGHKITFIIHPHDILESRSNSPKKAGDNARVRNMATKLGSRYQCVLVEMEAETDEPVISEDARSGSAAVASAGMLCRNPKFQLWIQYMGRRFLKTPECDEELGESNAASILRDMCNISSRSELKYSEAARESLDNLRTLFLEAVERADRVGQFAGTKFEGGDEAWTPKIRSRNDE